MPKRISLRQNPYLASVARLLRGDELGSRTGVAAALLAAILVSFAGAAEQSRPRSHPSPQGSGDRPSSSPAAAKIAASPKPRAVAHRESEEIVWEDPQVLEETVWGEAPPRPQPMPQRTGFLWCGPCSDAPCDPCWLPLHDRLWVHGEYLLWWTDPSDAPPLVTTSPAGTAANLAGVLGQPGVTVLFGDEEVGGEAHSGGRLAFGWWFDPCQCNGIEAAYLGLGRRTEEFRAQSNETPILARPFFDTQAGNEAAMLVAFPNLIRGSIAVDVATELQSAEAHWRGRLFTQAARHMDLLIGYRFARLDESLEVNQFSEWIAAQGVIIPGTTRTAFDRFDVENEFHGGQVGVVLHERRGCWSADLTMKVAIGGVRSLVAIDGATQTTVPNAGTANFVGGLLAQPTNIGSFEQDELAVIPELGATFGFDISRWLRATLGYTFLYWSQVARPADQIDLNVSQLPPEPPVGAQQPEFRLLPGDFWAQGLRLGLEYRF